MSPGPGTRQLPTTVAMELLASIRVGRIVFSRYALPAIHPADHILDAGQLIIRGDAGTGLSPESQAVTYEADLISSDTRSGWCVTVTGVADTVTDTADLARYRRLLPAGLSEPTDRIIRLHPAIVTGTEFTSHQ
ncbi:pyridoxamine 5'-phosphate oxidase family protein [Nocardia sp. NPDC052566]|uniref:pyridoxamine 5'-phosphate oxidase family protein n=1 Tax=Nocardia sp. NPDC052566 TaxID=3364330 RepID=UPI0037CC9778